MSHFDFTYTILKVDPSLRAVHVKYSVTDESLELNDRYKFITFILDSNGAVDQPQLINDINVTAPHYEWQEELDAKNAPNISDLDSLIGLSSNGTIIEPGPQPVNEQPVEQLTSAFDTQTLTLARAKASASEEL